MDKAEMASLFEAFGLTELWAQLQPTLLPSIKIHLETPEPTAVGASKIGGMPDLPAGFEWPLAHGKPLAFVAQINLSDIQALDGAQALPAAGWLYFFYDAVNEHWGDVPDDYWHFAVRFFAGDVAQLSTASAPAHLASENQFLGAGVHFVPQITFPDESSAAWPKLGMVRKQWMALGDLEEHIYEMNADRYNQLLGHSTNVQEGMEPLCTRMAKQFFEPDGTPNEWVLLLQLDSNDKECGMMWGDCGVLYYWIRRQDLLQQRFERCWCVMQCF